MKKLILVSLVIGSLAACRPGPANNAEVNTVDSTSIAVDSSAVDSTK